MTPNKNYNYPHELIKRCWEGLCLCQFHDTLPGSVIEICVKDSDGKYAELQEVGKRLLDEAYGVLYGAAPPTKENKGTALIINTLHGINRREVVGIPKAGSGVRSQQPSSYSDGTPIRQGTMRPQQASSTYGDGTPSSPSRAGSVTGPNQRKGAQASADGTETFVLVESIHGALCSNLKEGSAGDVSGMSMFPDIDQ